MSATTERKGIILAGGSGTRLWPTTIGVSKQLLPVYDKPMIYYPISVLLLMRIQEIAIITTPDDQAQFIRLLGDGSQWGVRFTYIVQPSPDGLAQAYLLTEEFLDGSPSVLILGDNIFYGAGLASLLRRANKQIVGGTIIGSLVDDARRYGVVDFDADGSVRALVEKPSDPPSNYAVTGLYFLDARASKLAAQIKPSPRGELEIVDLLEAYRSEGTLKLEKLGRGSAWLDTGTPDSLLDAGNFVRTVTLRQGLQVCSPDEIAWQVGLISDAQLAAHGARFKKNDYGRYLAQLAGQQVA